MISILEAIKEENIEQLIEILLIDPALIESKDEEGTWGPFLAATTGNFEIVKYIVEYSRASMNTVDEDNKNILHYAAKSNNVEMVRYLVERVGMDPCSGSRKGETPMDVAVEYGNQDVVNYFRNECGLKLENMYRNPIITGAHPDPSIVRVGEDYYMVNSSFTYFPGLPISHSKDLISWEIIGHGIADPSYLEDFDQLEDGRGFWAPDISYHKGRFYIVVTYRLNDGGPIYRRQLVVSSDRPEGPYSKPVFIDEDGIDPSIFTDDDDRRYMLLNRGARIFEVSEDCTKQLSKAELLWYGDNKRAPEGPHILKKDGYYYLFMAEGGTGITHCITVARSKTLMGPYESCPYNPIMTQRKPLEYIQRAGHGKPVQTQNGEWYMVYLCGRRLGEGYCILGRETSMDPITWTPDGWPIINGGKGPSVIQQKPSLPEHKWESRDLDHFEGEKLGLDWMFMRHPEKGGYKLQNSQLRIYGSSKDLYDMDAKNFIVRRQKHHVFTVETKMHFVASQEGQEAGLTGYYDTLTYFKLSVFQKNDTKVIRVIERIGQTENTYFEKELAKNEEVYLKIDTEYFKRIFYYSFDGEIWFKLGTLDNVYYLSDEGINQGKRFTGSMIGMYVIGGEYEQVAYADFEYFFYRA